MHIALNIVYIFIVNHQFAELGVNKLSLQHFNRCIDCHCLHFFSWHKTLPDFYIGEGECSFKKFSIQFRTLFRLFPGLHLNHREQPNCPPESGNDSGPSNYKLPSSAEEGKAARSKKGCEASSPAQTGWCCSRKRFLTNTTPAFGHPSSAEEGSLPRCPESGGKVQPPPAL